MLDVLSLSLFSSRHSQLFGCFGESTFRNSNAHFRERTTRHDLTTIWCHSASSFEFLAASTTVINCTTTTHWYERWNVAEARSPCLLFPRNLHLQITCTSLILPAMQRGRRILCSCLPYCCSFPLNITSFYKPMDPLPYHFNIQVMIQSSTGHFFSVDMSP